MCTSASDANKLFVSKLNCVCVCMLLWFSSEQLNMWHQAKHLLVVK